MLNNCNFCGELSFDLLYNREVTNSESESDTFSEIRRILKILVKFLQHDVLALEEHSAHV